MNIASLKATLAAVGDAPGLQVFDAAELYPRAERGQALLRYDGASCRAIVSLQGAQVLAFQPTGGPELLWTSPLATFHAGRPIRGGIPICLPWFGPHPDDPGQPKHGYARLRDWQLIAAAPLMPGGLGLRFELECDSRPEFPFPFRATLGIELAQTLRLQLDVYNKADAAMPLSWAFHSYLAVDGLASARVSGLAGRDYLDNAQPADTARGAARTDRPGARELPTATQRGDIRFGGEVDRVYTGVGGCQRLYSRPQPDRRTGQHPGQQLCAAPLVEIAGTGCDTVIVWNPGEPLGSGMADIGRHFDRFVCLERGAAFSDRWSIPPASSGSASMTLGLGSDGPGPEPRPDSLSATHPSQKER